MRSGAWTPANLETLRTMWDEGATASEIARALGPLFTRNAIIGKAHRLGLPARSSPLGQPTPGWSRPR